LACLGLLAVWAASGAAADRPPFATAELKFFEDKVRPLLIARCEKCHGKEKQRGGLRLDSRRAILKGGDSGPAAVPGNPDGSLLVLAVRHGEALKMPPQSKLTAAEIATLAAWVKTGLPWPDTAAVVAPPPPPQPGGPLFTAEQKSFWAFQKPGVRPLPPVRDPSWVQSPIDAFILARLEARGLRPAPPADPRTLIRRLSFDLIGLPPTPAEVFAFEQAAARDRRSAIAKVVDRLLASPHYGERWGRRRRWGRRWLDVVRYADSNGMDENIGYANAWRYRDYVVNAFNRDKPYDQFVREQLAGDLLPGDDPAVRLERIVATGFLCVGPKMLAEDDPVKMQMDIVDEQIDTVGQAFLGLTLGCARCHDHKFDPIPTADYYSLAGIFKSTQTMDTFTVIARWHERTLLTPEAFARQQAHDRVVAAKKAALDRANQVVREATVAAARRDLEKYVQAAQLFRIRRDQVRTPRSVLSDARRARDPAIQVVEAETYARGNLVRDTDNYGRGIGVIYNAGQLPNVAEFDVSVPAGGPYLLEIRHAAGVARPVKVLLNGQLVAANAAERVTGSWYPDTQTWVPVGIFAFSPGKNVLRLERDGPFPHIDKFALVPWLLPDGQPAPVPPTIEGAAAQHSLNAGFLSQWVGWLDGHDGKAPAGGALHDLAAQPDGPFRVTAEVENNFSKTVRDHLGSLRAEFDRLQKDRPAPPEAMAVEEGAIGNVRVHLRGNHLTQGVEAPRCFPRILAGERQPAIDGKQSGRLQLAQWLTQSDHPLTGRVLVNRVWLGHFGEGLVRSPDNFGRLGERPTHPELLDWLATRFVADGWSIKALHRLILLSSSYQMSTAYDEGMAREDPENRLFWRFNRQRLDAESLRDALLAIAGTLDSVMGGTLFQGANRQHVPGYPNSNYNGYDSNRRTLYLPVIRSEVYNVLQTFDFADPAVVTGKRPLTTVAPQALFLMNGKLVHEQTRRLAEKLVREAPDEASRVALLYEKVFAQRAGRRDLARSLDFVQRYRRELADSRLPAAEADLRSWQALCRVVLSANRFLFVE
jgi:hypothetical protein